MKGLEEWTITRPDGKSVVGVPLWADKDGLTAGEPSGGRSNVGNTRDLRIALILTVISALVVIGVGTALVWVLQ